MRKGILSSAAKAKRAREREAIRIRKQQEEAKSQSDLSIQLMNSAFDNKDFERSFAPIQRLIDR